MKVMIVHNEYGKFSGEEAVVRDQVNLLKSKGHDVVKFTRSSAEIPGMFVGKLRAFFGGVYNPFSVRKFRKFLKLHRPDIIHVHNLYPFISPAILPEGKKARIPVVMTVHNFRLICPNGLFMNQNGICEKCSGGKEWNCVRYNCENSRFKSTGYALRNWFSRKRRYYLNNVNVFVALSEFQRQKLITNGFPEEKTVVLPNMNAKISKNKTLTDKVEGEYIAYAGRLSKEKGIDLIIEAAAKLPHIKFKLAGDGAEQFIATAPTNVEFCGYLTDNKLDDFYYHCRFLIMPSTWYETFGLVIVEAMRHAKPVIVPDLGSLPEVVGGSDCGMIFNPDNINDFISKIEYLWNNPNYSAELGTKAQKRALLLYSPEVFYAKLMAIYEREL